ncbi:MAG TPA: hypothetical protein VGF98_07485 [Candidatus Tumulicola sp.]|jgi:hypothetical protein
MKLIRFSAGVEAATGLVLIVGPSLVARLLLGTELSAGGEAVGRIAGFALLALGLACWPQTGSPSRATPAVRGLLIYNVLAAIFFLYVGFRREFMGLLLWPAAGLHAALGILFARIFFVSDRD